MIADALAYGIAAVIGQTAVDSVGQHTVGWIDMLLNDERDGGEGIFACGAKSQRSVVNGSGVKWRDAEGERVVLLPVVDGGAIA